jgi:predicted CoA-binding protein
MDLPEQVLRDSTTIAVVGASRDPEKAAHSIPLGLQRAGFRILPINPHADTLFGQPVSRALADLEEPVDLVLMFRPSNEAPEIAKQAVAIRAKALWLQQGLRSPEAQRIATQAGLAYVEDECSGVVRSIHRIEKPRPK